MGISYTYILIGVTALVSFGAWSNGELMFKSFFIPVNINERKEYWRFFSHGFVHADQQHLIFNMITLFFFGPIVEFFFAKHFGSSYFFCVILLCRSHCFSHTRLH